MTLLRIEGGRIIHPDLRITRGDVLVDQSAGTIVGVGDVPEGDAVLDAKDGLVLPGFVNGHTHVAMSILRGYSDNKPLHEWLRDDIKPAEDALSDEDLRDGATLGILEMIKSGTTAFVDMYFRVSHVAESIAEAGIRARIGDSPTTAGKSRDEALESIETGLQVALKYHGYADGRITTGFMPPTLGAIEEEFVSDVLPTLRDEGIPVHYHANETLDGVRSIVNDHGLRPLEHADEMGLLADGDSIAHGVHLDASEMDLLERSGAAVVNCPGANMKLASGIAPVRELLDRGITVGLGTDGPASNNNLDMLSEMRDAALSGKIDTMDAGALTAESVFRMATAGSASAAGFESGRIAEGANADIVVLDLESPRLTPDHDTISNMVYSATGSDVRHTICDGRILMRERNVLTLDESAVRARARESAERLRERISS